ncbi:MAG: TlpA family protein disulfide reductase [Planctomycetota bacterium]|jgi:thiol-disulfide isomerase/thioredoxin
MKKRLGILMLCAAVLVGCAEEDEGNQADQAAKPEASASTAPEQVADPTAQAAPAAYPTKLGDAAYPLTGLTWVKGEPVTIAPGKVYVVEFWATWCPPCLKSIPHLTALQKKHKDRVVFVGVSNEDPGVVKPFVENQGDNMDYTVAIDSTGAVGKGYMRAFGQGGIPTAFVVDANGKIVWHGHPLANLDAVLEKVLAGTYAIPG